jgi:hypothetical protein
LISTFLTVPTKSVRVRKKELSILILDKLIFVIIIALVGWYINVRMKKFENELQTQREVFLGSIKIENDRTIKQIDMAFQSQQAIKQQNFAFELERFKSFSNFINDTKKTKNENRRNSFAKLMSLKIPWQQYLTTHLEAQMLSDYYERRYQLFTHNIEDFNEAKRQNDRGIALINDISSIQRDVFETIGLIQISFDINSEIQNAIDDLYNFKGVNNHKFPVNFKTESELDAYYQSATTSIGSILREEYGNKIEKLLTLLRKELKK